MSEQFDPYRITVEYEGKEYSARYSCKSGIVEVITVYGSRTAQVGGTPPDALARLLFHEILRESGGKSI